MRQVWLTKVGGPDALVLREASDPRPHSGQVRIRVKAAGVNFADVMARHGLYQDAPKLPCVLGYEVAGEIEEVGSRVEGFVPGERVLAVTRFQGYADTVCVSAPSVWRLPARLTFEQGAALPVNYLTALLMLRDMAHAQPGESVLVHNLGGGVGIAALQIARILGLDVIGTASAAKHERLRALGAEKLIDYRTEDFEAGVLRFTSGRGVDVALDAVGGKSFLKSYRSLAPFGRLVAYGAASLVEPGLRKALALAQTLAIPTFAFHPVRLMNDNRALMGFNLGHLWEETARLGAAMEWLLGHVAEGAVAPIVDRAFPLAEAGAAHMYLEERRNFGKIVLQP